MLIDRWIGEGFLGKSKYMSKRSIYEMRDEGRSIIEKLKPLFLLEDAIDDIDWQRAIKMHDVIRDMALWLARDRDENKGKVVVQREALVMDSERFNVIQKISVIGVNGTWQQVPVYPNLLTLCAQRDLKIIEYSNLQHMTRLKVLDLSGNDHIESLPIEIGKLINLEFLNLSDMGTLDTLPIELKNLKKLRVFLLEDTETKIPLEVFEGLERLQVFRIPWLVEEKREEILLLDKLESLPELEELGVTLQTITGRHKLLNPNKLQGCVRKFELLLIETEPMEMELLLASWSTMKHLETILLIGLNDIREVSSVTHTCHLGKLRELTIVECNSITHLTWLKYAPLLEFLHVEDCNSMEEVVKGGQDEDDEGIDLFSNLRHLVLDDLPKLKSIHKRAFSFPSLKSIRIDECQNLRKFPLNSNSAKDILIEIRGDTEWWNKLEWDNPTTKDVFHSKFQPSH